jgi:hypothetical protein
MAAMLVTEASTKCSRSEADNVCDTSFTSVLQDSIQTTIEFTGPRPEARDREAIRFTIRHWGGYPQNERRNRSEICHVQELQRRVVDSSCPAS